MRRPAVGRFGVVGTLRPGLFAWKRLCFLMTWKRAIGGGGDLDSSWTGIGRKGDGTWGGAFALPFLIEQPDRVAGFVAIAPVAIDRYRDRLAQIECPVLATWGENDRTIPVEHADALVAAIARGSKFIVPGGSHAPYMSGPATFHRELLRFLGEGS